MRLPDLITARRLADSVLAADKKMEDDRDCYKQAIEDFVGPRHRNISEPSDHDRVPLNQIHRGVVVLLAHLMSTAPEHEVVARSVMLRGEAIKLSLILDWTNRDNNRVDVSRLVLMDALLSPVGITRVGLRDGEELYQLDDAWYDPGKPYLRRVPFDRWIVDPTAANDHEIRWEAERFRVSRSVAIASGIFEPSLIEQVPLVQDEQSRYSAAASEEVSGKDPSDDDSYVADEIELMEVALYNDHGCYIVTLPSQPDQVVDYLSVREWTENSRGPFERLTLCPVPNQTLGVPWHTSVKDAAEGTARVMTKIIRQVVESKRVGLVKGGPQDTKFVDKLANASDQSLLSVPTGATFELADLGGVIPDLFSVLGPLQQWFNIGSGNTDMLGGSEGDTKTATEASQLQANAGVVLQDLQQIHRRFEERVSRRLLDYIISDPVTSHELPYRMPTGEEVNVVYGPENKQGSRKDFDLQIRQQSTATQDPNVRVRRLIEFINIFAPMGVINPMVAAKVFGEQARIDRLPEMILDPMALAEQEMALQQASMGMQRQPMQAGVGNQQALGGQMPAKKGGVGGPSNKQTTGGGARSSPRQMAGAGA